MASKKSRKTDSRSRTAHRNRHHKDASDRQESAYNQSSIAPEGGHDAVIAAEHYRREKARREGERRGAADDPLAEARREYRAMLAADAARQKGGRPRKASTRPSDANDDADLDADEPDSPQGDGGAPEQ